MSTIRPEDLLDQPVPDLVLPDQDSASYALRQWTGRSPFVVFMYSHSGSPG